MTEKKRLTSQQKLSNLPHKTRRTNANKIRRILKSSGRGAAETFAAKCGMADYLKSLPAYRKIKNAES